MLTTQGNRGGYSGGHKTFSSCQGLTTGSHRGRIFFPQVATRKWVITRKTTEIRSKITQKITGAGFKLTE